MSLDDFSFLSFFSHVHPLFPYGCLSYLAVFLIYTCWFKLFCASEWQ